MWEHEIPPGLPRGQIYEQVIREGTRRHHRRVRSMQALAVVAVVALAAPVVAVNKGGDDNADVVAGPGPRGKVDDEALEPPPWAAPPLPPASVPVPVVESWGRSSTRTDCPAMSFDGYGAGEGGNPRAADFGPDAWAVAWDKPGAPGQVPSGEDSPTAGRSTFGIAGIGKLSPSDPTKGAAHQRRWADGSAVGYGPSSDSTTLWAAHLRVATTACPLYRVWSNLGQRHLEDLLERLRFVPTGGPPSRVTATTTPTPNVPSATGAQGSTRSAPPPPPKAAAAAAARECKVRDFAISAVTSRKTATYGGSIGVSVTITNKSATSCVAPTSCPDSTGPGQFGVKVYNEAGEEVGSGSANGPPPSECRAGAPHLFGPGGSYTRKFIWCLGIYGGSVIEAEQAPCYEVGSASATNGRYKITGSWGVPGDAIVSSPEWVEIVT